MNQYQSLEIEKLVTALSKAQSEMREVKKDSKNTYFKADYGDLTSVWRACKTALFDNGLSVIQTMDHKEEEIILVTTLAHTSGQWMRSYLPLAITKRSPQEVGSAITYARRYALAAIVCICPEGDDDDAEEAMKEARKKEIEKPKEEKPIEDTKISAAQVEILEAKINKEPQEKWMERICSHFRVQNLYDMKEKDFAKAMEVINKSSKKKVAANVN